MEMTGVLGVVWVSIELFVKLSLPNLYVNRLISMYESMLLFSPA